MVDQTTYERPPHGWTCFHCGETFTTVGSARVHFGATPDAKPGCMVRVGLGGERGLLMALRKAEEDCRAAWDAVQGESTEAHRALHAMLARHTDALEQAEISGYERGLKDGRRVVPHKLPVPPPQADMLDVVYAEGWNACCDAFFGGLPAPDPVVITVTERDSRVGELEEELRDANAAYASQMRELHALKEELGRLRGWCRPSYDPADAEIEKLLRDK